MIGSDRGDRFTHVAHDVLGEDRLVARDQAIGGLAGDVIGEQDAGDTIDLQRSRNVDRENSRIWVRGAQGCPPQHVGGEFVGRELEVPANFRRSVGAQDARAEGVAIGRDRGAHRFIPRTSMACCTASKIRP